MCIRILLCIFCATLFLGACDSQPFGIENDTGTFSIAKEGVAEAGFFLDDTLTENLLKRFYATAYEKGSVKKPDGLSVLFTDDVDLYRFVPWEEKPPEKEPIPPPAPTAGPHWVFRSPNQIVLSFQNAYPGAAFGEALPAFFEDATGEAPYQEGWSITPELREHFARIFEETKECTGFSYGALSLVALYLAPGEFPCGEHTCAGFFNGLNTIRTNSHNTVKRHEFVHFLLFFNTFNTDPKHESPLFKTCVQ